MFCYVIFVFPIVIWSCIANDLMYLRAKRCWSLVASGLYQAEPSVSTAIKRKRRAAVTFRHKQLIKRSSVLNLSLTKPIPAMSVSYFRKNNSIWIISKNITDIYFISNGKIVVHNSENMRNVKHMVHPKFTPLIFLLLVMRNIGTFVRKLEINDRRALVSEF